jgi:hypothetical protein
LRGAIHLELDSHLVEDVCHIPEVFLPVVVLDSLVGCLDLGVVFRPVWFRIYG